MIIQNSGSFQNSSSDEHSKLSFIDIDIVVTESIAYNQVLTDKPVEDGTHISDNIIIMPTTLLVDCIILPSDTGVTIYDKFEEIQELRLRRELFDVVTSIGSFSDMFFDTPITVNRDRTNTNAIVFSATLKQVTKISSEVRFVPTQNTKKEAKQVGGDERQRGGTVDKGKKKGEEPRRTDAIIGLLGI